MTWPDGYERALILLSNRLKAYPATIQAILVAARSLNRPILCLWAHEIELCAAAAHLSISVCSRYSDAW